MSVVGEKRTSRQTARQTGTANAYPALLFVSTLAEAASFYFVFTGDARPWFQRQNPE
jgi:hypothetical protein